MSARDPWGLWDKLDAIDRRLDALATAQPPPVTNTDQLLPLSVILDISSKAASARMRRDPCLRAVGVQVGRSVLFRRGAVESYYQAQAAPRLRAVR